MAEKKEGTKSEPKNKYRIKTGTYQPKSGKPLGKGDEIELTYDQAKRFGLKSLERIGGGESASASDADLTEREAALADREAALQKAQKELEEDRAALDKKEKALAAKNANA